MGQNLQSKLPSLKNISFSKSNHEIWSYLFQFKFKAFLELNTVNARISALGAYSFWVLWGGILFETCAYSRRALIHRTKEFKVMFSKMWKINKISRGLDLKWLVFNHKTHTLWQNRQQVNKTCLYFHAHPVFIRSAQITAHGRLFETCAYSFKMLLGWALIRDVCLFETCAYS